MGPYSCGNSGPHPAEVPPARPQEDSERGQLPGSPAGRPRGGGGGQETAARGPTAGAAERGGACSRFPQHPRGLPQRIPGRLPVRHSGSGTHSHGPLPALLQRGSGSSDCFGGPGSRWAFEERRGGGAGCSRPGGRIPSWRGRRPPGGAAQAAALCAPRESTVRWVKRCAPGPRRTRCCEGSLASVPAASWRAGLRGLRLTRPLLLSRGSPLPAGSALDRWRNCNDTPLLPRLLTATSADAPALQAPTQGEEGAGRTLRVAGPATLSTGPSGATSGDHWCRGGGGTEMGGATEWVERNCGRGHPGVLY